MLKALEIFGFKSFADRTRFEFRPGITAVVGPNGSGKSNVVDAIKWVLGEQSIKNLRGKEMTDVIFNGSATRRPMNYAEITITLDNSRGILPIDTAEVHITRRVYRSGESEYLINRQPSRLRDIRDLLSGTGLGTQAYSVIEQGKIDQLLQASPLDRRVVFEEAAGISRFKSRKLEAQRRLERLEQNLLRLNDIVEEVDNRLRVVRSQAGKAQRYQKYAERLKALRTHLARLDWQRLNTQLTRLDEHGGELATWRRELERENGEVASRLAELDELLNATGGRLAELQAGLSDNREWIAAAESDRDHERLRSREAEGELSRLRKSLATLNLRAGDLQAEKQATQEALQAAETQHRDLARQVADGERLLTERLAALDRRRGEYEQRRNQHWEILQQILALDGRLQQYQRDREQCEKRCQGNRGEWQRLQGQSGELRQLLEDLTVRAGQLLQELEAVQSGLQTAVNSRDKSRQECQQLRERSSTLERQRTAAAERIKVLQEWEDRLEGLSLGVKDFLQRIRHGEQEVASSVCGLVADLFQSELQAALLVDIALGEAAEWIVLRDGAPWLEDLRRGSAALSGKVCVVCLDHLREKLLAVQKDLPPLDLRNQPGVLGCAEEFVQTEDIFRPLRQFLLANTWFVESLDIALNLASQTIGLRFVTLAGELVTSEGVVVAGPRTSGLGLISRRSELRSLHQALAEWDRELADLRQQLDAVERQVAEAERVVSELEEKRRRLAEELKETERRKNETQKRLQDHTTRLAQLEQEIGQTEQERERLAALIQQTQQEKAALEGQANTLADALGQLGGEIATLESDVQEHNALLTTLKVELAKGEERLNALARQLRRHEEAERERQQEIADLQNRIRAVEENLLHSERTILQRESELAELYTQKDILTAELRRIATERGELQRQRLAAAQQVEALQQQLKTLEAKQHKLELELTAVRQEKAALMQRIEEDYGIALAELEQPPDSEEARPREEIQAEVEDLRRKINNLGNVNLEALEELQQLEERYNTLATQYRDLVSAKTSLQRIIERINADSRRLFAATLQTVSEHFGTLFRELFGGGHASIELDAGVDILESGIEIVARPPGKEPRNISLLSGGEKSLTCVALLLAIFRSRPSPFCVLDEVDAALDEVNIDRFTKVLRDFLSITQFVIVTHSKRTASCADTLYGITMQESGVSKRVSVRFEDLSDQGEILSTATDQAETSSTADRAA